MMKRMINLPRQLRGLFTEDGKNLTWLQMQEIVEAAAKQLEYYENTWEKSLENAELLKAHDAGYEVGYRAAMEEIISIAQDIKQEHQGDD